MKKTKYLIALSVILSGVLVACNSNDDSNQEPTTDSNESGDLETEGTEDDQNNENNDSGDDEGEVEDENSDGGTDDSVLTSGDFDDQLDLSIGDTGSVDTLIGQFDVTVNDVELLEDIDGEMSELDYFLLVNYTVKNIGNEELDAREAIDSMESTHRLEGSGYSDNAQYYDQFEAIEGTLAPDEEVTGEALYSAYDGEEYFIRVTDGLVGSGAAKNKIQFNVQKNEIE